MNHRKTDLGIPYSLSRQKSAKVVLERGLIHTSRSLTDASWINGTVVGGELVVACRDPTTRLKLIEEPLKTALRTRAGNQAQQALGKFGLDSKPPEDTIVSGSGAVGDTGNEPPAGATN